MITDPISDLLTRLRNSQMAGHKSARVRKSKLAIDLLNVLKTEGFIAYFEEKPAEEGAFTELEVGLKYYPNGQPGITELARLSKPGYRKYVKTGELGKVHHGLGVAIVSTSEGLMSDREARMRKIGGELIARVA